MPTSLFQLTGTAVVEALIDDLATFQECMHACGVDTDALRLLPWQRSGVEFALRALCTPPYEHGVVLAHEMGLGKTAQAIVCALLMQKMRWLAAGARGRPVLVLCPKSVTGSWRRQLGEYCRAAHVSVLHVLTSTQWESTRGGETSVHAGAPASDDVEAHDIVLASYDALKCEFARATKRAWTAARTGTTQRDARYEWTCERNRSALDGTGDLACATPHITARCTHLSPLLRTHYGTVVYDESHCMRNPNTDLAYFCNALWRERALLLSGTPMQSDVRDVWSQLRVCHAHPLPTFATVTVPRSRMRRFEAEMEAARRAGTDMRVWCAERSHDRRLYVYAVIEALLERYVCRVTKADVGEREPDTLPECSVRSLRVELSKDERRVYAALQHRRYAEYAELRSCVPPGTLGRHVAASALSLRHAAASPRTLPQSVINTLCAEARTAVSRCRVPTKFRAVAEYVGLVDADERIVVFCHHVAPVEALAAHLRSAGVECDTLVGCHGAERRRSTIADFVGETGGARVLIATNGAGQEGVNLQRANHVLFLTGDWNEAAMRQALARVHRLGSTRDVHAVHVVAVDTIDELMAEQQATWSAASVHERAALLSGVQ